VKRSVGVLVLLGAAACAAPAARQPSSPAATAGELALGERVYLRRCFACHALEPGRNTPAGPTLNDIAWRPIAAEPGFDYSPALRRLAEHNGRWSPMLLDHFLADPAAVAPGSEMGFPGLGDAAERRAVIRWLEAQRPRD
jgi:cytochrome c